MSKYIQTAKLIITVTSGPEAQSIHTASVYDNRTGQPWTPDQIAHRGISDFLDLADLMETLNWNLNGDAQKYQFRWGPTGRRTGSTGTAMVYD